jgi:hypothetical protein
MGILVSISILMLFIKLFDRYCGIYGTLDWVKLQVHNMIPAVETTAMDIDCTQPFRNGDIFDQDNDEGDFDDSDELDDQPSAAPSNRIEELNATLEALGPMMCNILRPNSEKVFC